VREASFSTYPAAPAFQAGWTKAGIVVHREDHDRRRRRCRAHPGDDAQAELPPQVQVEHEQGRRQRAK
jgi:hypothetical protein